jgi:uncharacterized protein YaeQ
MGITKGIRGKEKEMTSYLSEDNPEAWEKAKEHILDWKPEHDDASYPEVPKCKKCCRKAVQKMNMLWICPELYDIPDKYFHEG